MPKGRRKKKVFFLGDLSQICLPTPGFLWDLGEQKVKFGSTKAIFGVIFFLGVWTLFGNQPPLGHPATFGKTFPNKTFFGGKEDSLICFSKKRCYILCDLSWIPSSNTLQSIDRDLPWVGVPPTQFSRVQRSPESPTKAHHVPSQPSPFHWAQNALHAVTKICDESCQKENDRIWNGMVKSLIKVHRFSTPIYFLSHVLLVFFVLRIAFEPNW